MTDLLMTRPTSDVAPGGPTQVMPVFYATRDGQSQRIGARIVERLGERGIRAMARNLISAAPTSTELADASLVVLLASVRYGRHLPEADRFLAAYKAAHPPPPLALASVNLTARKPDKSTAEDNPYVRKLLARHGLRPVLAAAFAGRLDYPRYRALDRQIIRVIMWLTGGPTDPSTCIEYTSWNAVDDFASQLANLAAVQTRPEGGRT